MQISKFKVSSREVMLTITAVVVLFNLYFMAWLPPSPYLQRGIFMASFIVISILINPPASKAGKFAIIPFAIAAVAGALYPAVFEEKIYAQRTRAFDAEVYMFFVFLVGFVAVLLRSGGGIIIAVMAVGAVLYVMLGQYIPGYFGHRTLPVEYLVTMLYLDTNDGIFGMFTRITTHLVSIFMIFAALLLATGLGEFFTAVATRFAGNATGGPAKISVISSGLFGMLSGSPVANVMATGSFTIPAMKNVGYRPSAAATTEALASTGGNLMPPIMGAGAFLMAEILGVSYLKIIIIAIIPAVLWYIVCYMIVHFYAKRQGIKKWRPSKEEFMKVIREKYHLSFAILALIGAMLYFADAGQAAFYAVIFLLLLTNLRKGTRLNKAKIAFFLSDYANMLAPLFIMVVGLSMFISTLAGTGVSIKLGLMLFGGFQQWYLILLIAFILIVALGALLPITAAYLAAVMVITPVLVQQGYSPFVVHFFVFYAATLAPITPPVAFATYAAARIAGSDFFKTGLEASLRGLPLFIIPFALFQKALFFGIGTPISTLATGVATLLFGSLVFVFGWEGYFTRTLKMLERAILVVLGLIVVLPTPDLWTYTAAVAALVFIGFSWAVDIRRNKIALKAAISAPTSK